MRRFSKSQETYCTRNWTVTLPRAANTAGIIDREIPILCIKRHCIRVDRSSLPHFIARITVSFCTTRARTPSDHRQILACPRKVRTLRDGREGEKMTTEDILRLRCRGSLTTRGLILVFLVLRRPCVPTSTLMLFPCILAFCLESLSSSSKRGFARMCDSMVDVKWMVVT